MGGSIKRVQAIKTHSSIFGSGAHSNERHVHQFQLASLELERTRRGRERTAALRRIAEVDARLAEIDAIILKHQEALGLTNGAHSTQIGTVARSASGAVPGKRRILRY